MTLRLLLLLSLFAPPAEAKKLVLYIEIGRYQHGRSDLHTARDAHWLHRALGPQGFDSLRLFDKQATAAGIRHAFEALSQRAGPGDVVVIHFGGHGTQLADQKNGDEPDGKDEALVPYDAPHPAQAHTPAYQQSPLFIRDDELGTYLTALRHRVEPRGHVLVLIDACYSGTLSRGQEARLRTDNIVATMPPPMAADSVVSGWFELQPSPLRTRPTSVVVLMAGAQAHQKHNEIRDPDNQWVGPLALFFSQTLAATDGPATYRSVFLQIEARMRDRIMGQLPTLEGDASATLFGGKLIRPATRARQRQEADWLRKRIVPHPAMRVVASLHPAEYRNNVPVLRTTRQATLSLRNTGNVPVYVTVIDIQPDDAVSVLFPNNRYRPDSLWLRPGQVRTYALGTMAPPLGLEHLKLLLTRTRADVATPATYLLTRFPDHPRPTPDEAALLDVRFWIDKP
jgi:hypothetical protein